MSVINKTPLTSTLKWDETVSTVRWKMFGLRKPKVRDLSKDSGYNTSSLEKQNATTNRQPKVRLGAKPVSSSSKQGVRTERRGRTEKQRERVFVKQHSAICDQIISNYKVPGECLGYIRGNLQAIIMPMGHGKTYYRTLHGFIDFDDCASKMSEKTGVDSVVRELTARLDWEGAMKGMATEANRTLDMMTFSKNTLILLHDQTMADNIGAKVIGTIVMNDKLFEKSISTRTRFQQEIARINKRIVESTSDSMVIADSFEEIEATILDMCHKNSIVTGCPWKYKAGSDSLEYATDDDYVLSGQCDDINMLIGLYEGGIIPKERIDYYINKNKMDPYRGFGVTKGDWASVLGENSGDRKHEDGRLNQSELAKYSTIDYKEISVMEERLRHFGDRYVTSVLAHWKIVGQKSKKPEIFFKLYTIGSRVWFTKMQEICRLLAKSNSFMDIELCDELRSEITDLRFMIVDSSAELNSLMIASGSESGGMVNKGIDAESAEAISKFLDVEEPICISNDDRIELLNNIKEYPVSYLTAWMESTLSEYEFDNVDSLIRMLGKTPVSNKVLICMLLYYSRKNRHDIMRICEEISQVPHYNKMLCSDAIHYSIHAIESSSEDCRDKWSIALINLMCDDEFIDGQDWAKRYIKSIEELILNGGTCVAYKSKFNSEARAQVIRSGRAKCSTTIDSHCQFTNSLSATQIDLNKLNISTSSQCREVMLIRGLKIVGKSRCLAINDAIRNKVRDTKAMICQIAHLREIIGDSTDAIDLINTFRGVNGAAKIMGRDQLLNLDKAVYGDKEANGFGFAKEGGMVYKLQNKLELCSYSEGTLRKKRGNKMVDYKATSDNKGAKLTKKYNQPEIELGRVVGRMQYQERVSALSGGR